MNPNDQHVVISKAMGWKIGNPENPRLDFIYPYQFQTNESHY